MIIWVYLGKDCKPELTKFKGRDDKEKGAARLAARYPKFIYFWEGHDVA